MPLETAFDDGESLLYARRAGKPLVLLAGHSTPSRRRATCPAGSRTAGSIGLGASDMKGGVAVMIELARWAAEAELAYDVGFLFFPREELGPHENPLPAVFERHR